MQAPKPQPPIKKIDKKKMHVFEEIDCGLFEFDDAKAGDEDAARADVYLYGREKRAGEYAQSCYDPGEMPELMRCNSFYNSSITFDRPKHEQICPFKDPTICAGGYSPGSGVTFDIGIVDASILGIDFEPSHKFRRKPPVRP